VQLLTATARAYIYNGMWVADCPTGCGGTEPLFEAKRRGGPKTVRRTLFHCSYCRFATSRIEWPADEVALMTVLELRPIPHTRNWYPTNHEVAVRFGIPHGQSVRDLQDENAEHGVPTLPSEVA
jgi:hypothetical protein